jgi:hypothetical protein
VSVENPKTYQPARGENKQEKSNKIHADNLELYLIIKMSHINGKGLESTNYFCIPYWGLDKLTTHLDQQLFLINHINAIISSQSLKLYFQTI